MYRPGDIYWIPRALSYHSDPKDHRLHTLLNVCDVSTHAAAAYGSTSGAETRNGTISRIIPPRRSGPFRNGLREDTHFYPVVLRPTRANELDDAAGRLTDEELSGLKRLVPIALGFNSGNCYARGAATGSRRGMIVQVDDSLARLTGTQFAVILTSHPYSAKAQGFLAVVPLLLDSDPEEGHDVLIEHEMSFKDLDPEAESALMLVTSIYSIRGEVQIKRATTLTVPSPQLRTAEQILKRWLGL